MVNKAPELGVIIAAAGDSQRMGNLNKIFATLGNKPLLAWSVDTCQNCHLIDQIVIALRSDDLELGQKLAREREWTKVTDIYPGGPLRQDSVKRGLHKLVSCDWVMIHDGARPFLTLNLIQKGLEAVRETGAAIAAVPVNETIKLANGTETIEKTLQRSELWIAQTPQMFKFEIITKAYEKLTMEVTDDAAAVERLGCKVKLFPGTHHNIKITTPTDLALAEVIVSDVESGYRL
jgi:2-C-methyl-D-erythritol 4-phosphate cytidylyltransferase